MVKPHFVFKNQFESEEQANAVLKLSFPFYINYMCLAASCTALFEVFMLMRIFLGFSSGGLVKHLHYGLCYVFLFTISVLLVIACLKWRKDLDRYYKHLYKLEISYNLGITIWVILITLLDGYYHHSYDLILYMAILLIIPVISYENPYILILTQLISHIIIFVAIVINGGPGIIMNFSAFIAVSLSATLAFNHTKKILFLKQYQLNEIELKKLSSELENAKEKGDAVLKSILALANIYHTLHVINLSDNTVYEYRHSEEINNFVSMKDDAINMMRAVMNYVPVEECREKALEFTDLTTISERMKDCEFLSEEFIGIFHGWFRGTFIVIDRNADKTPKNIIFASQIIEDEKQREEKLLRISKTDELTGLLNRRAYDEALAKYTEDKSSELSVLSMDINGLKKANDTLGHSAGDELIQTAAKLMKDYFGKYGDVFRTGGDEFVALLNTDKNTIEKAIKKFQRRTENWQGKQINEISVSCGIVNRCDFPNETMEHLVIQADKMMYKMKSEYYIQNGFDRRNK